MTEKYIPKRLRIMIALQKHLEQIAVADGYNYDLADKVFRNRILLGDDVRNLGTAVSVVEAPRPDIALYAAENNAWSRSHITLLIQGVVKDDKTVNTEDDAHYLENDVERSLLRIIEVNPSTGKGKYPGEYLLGGIIAGAEIAPPVVRPPEATVSSSAFFYLAVRLEVAGKIGE